MPMATVNAASPVSLYYQVHRPLHQKPGEERGRFFLCMGYQSGGFLWAAQTRHLVKQGFACVTFDNRQFGRSSRPVCRCTTAMLARDAMELLCTELGWRPSSTHLAAISLGGMYGLEMLAGLREGAFADIAGPEETAFLSAALLVTQAEGWRSPRGTLPLKYTLNSAMAFVSPASGKARATQMLETSFSREWLRAESGIRHPKTGKALTNADTLIRSVAKEYYAAKAEGIDTAQGRLFSALSQAMAIVTHRVAPERMRALAEHLVDAKCPVLVVCAGKDRLVRYSAQRRVAEALGPAVVELLDMPDSAHGVNGERASEVNDALLRLATGAAERRLAAGEGAGTAEAPAAAVRVRSRL